MRGRHLLGGPRHTRQQPSQDGHPPDPIQQVTPPLLQTHGSLHRPGDRGHASQLNFGDVTHHGIAFSKWMHGLLNVRGFGSPHIAHRGEEAP
ncbi:hypothetical protein DB31_0328 [Hyalangium minutum]|uniref:Uncharacterized protein n=1 Tax=Hyalangium minutum TaxID=394096 RepID=A0A085WWK4_9BACT|nr:hypothetical protein DB31_0328 [Hyalangium minutum]